MLAVAETPLIEISETDTMVGIRAGPRPVRLAHCRQHLLRQQPASAAALAWAADAA